MKPVMVLEEPVVTGFPRTVERLNHFLSQEHAAVESYRVTQARFGLTDAQDWATCIQDHQVRVGRLATRIHELDGVAVGTAGAWAGIDEGLGLAHHLSASRSVLGGLRSGENRCLADYLGRLGDLDQESRRLVTEELRPGAFITHEAVRRICARSSMTALGVA